MPTIGIDEVGRGALAGPVVVGAVLLPDGFEVPDVLGRPLRDSKQHSRAHHAKVSDFVTTNLTWGIGEVSVAELHEIGLSAALKLAADRALSPLLSPGAVVQADAGLFHTREAEFRTQRFIKGDDTYLPITLASHLAKYYRDSLMVELARQHEGYAWETNVGYGTKAHRKAILELGNTIHHRELFLRKLLGATQA
ncbi:ribonuclease HII [soil metagenome]